MGPQPRTPRIGSLSPTTGWKRQRSILQSLWGQPCQHLTLRSERMNSGCSRPHSVHGTMTAASHGLRTCTWAVRNEDLVGPTRYNPEGAQDAVSRGKCSSSPGPHWAARAWSGGPQRSLHHSGLQGPSPVPGFSHNLTHSGTQFARSLLVEIQVDEARLPSRQLSSTTSPVNCPRGTQWLQELAIPKYSLW